MDSAKGKRIPSYKGVPVYRLRSVKLTLDF
jgi:hypothetical protein